MTYDGTLLLDCDNTLLDNDRVQVDLKEQLTREFGGESRDRYWSILEQLRSEVGYVDYLGALQRYRLDARSDPRLLLISSFLVDYPAVDLVRGQYAGYRREPNVARHSDVETFCALRLFIDSWRWEGVPWYLRSGKRLPATFAEVIVQLKPPPQRLFADSTPPAGRADYLRFRLSPNSAVALAARVKHAGKEFVGALRELYLMDHEPGEEAPYERLLTDAMAGDGALFTREDTVEAAWAVVDDLVVDCDNGCDNLFREQGWGAALRGLDSRGAHSTGSATENVLPLPSSDSAQMRPRWASTIRRAM